MASNNFLAAFNTSNGTTYNCKVCHTQTTPTSPYARNQFGTDWANASIGNHSYVITTALANLDSDGDGFTNIVEIQANTNPGDPASHPTSGADTTLPVVTGFTIPSTSTTLNVPITTLTATDNVGVTGYLVNEYVHKAGSKRNRLEHLSPGQLYLCHGRGQDPLCLGHRCGQQCLQRPLPDDYH